ncbi:MAG: acyltransferase domain-containing protein, partial [bacterium]
SRPFDARANGFVMAEGVGICILKRFSDAIKDGDRIYAVINAVGSSSDGKGKGIAAPNPKGQKMAIERTFCQLDYTPGEVKLVEAHGTATLAGDPAEAAVLNEIWSPYVSSRGSAALGSVKSQIGHSKAAAGAASVIKAALALHNKVLPPSINFVTPNPKIDFKNSPFRIQLRAEEWVSDGKTRKANVSAFGFGGTNFHIALEEFDASSPCLADPRMFREAEKPAHSGLHYPTIKLQSEAIIISAPSRESFLNKMNSVASSMEPAENQPMILHSHPLNTLNQEKYAVALTAESPSRLREKLEFLAKQAVTDEPWRKPSLHLKMKGIYPFHPKASRAKVGFLFPGQGSQYVDMMKDLADKYPVVQETFAEANAILCKLINTTLTEMLFSKPGETAEQLAKREEAIKQTQLTQPAMLTADMAMMRLLGQFGVRPDMVCGHSLGEYAAAVAAGVFTFENGLRAVTTRAKEMSNIKVADPGKMASVAASYEKVEKELKKINGYVICANKNCPTQTVIAGEKTAVEDAVKLFTSMGIQSGEIPVSHAFHSAIIAPASEPYKNFLRKIPMSAPSIPLLSNVTAGYFPADADKTLDLLVKQLSSPVEFIKQLERMYADGVRMFVECGPKRVLSAFATGTFHDKKDIFILSSNHPKRGGILEFNDALANLTSQGVRINWNGKNPLETGNVYSPAYVSWVRSFAATTAAQKSEITRLPAVGQGNQKSEVRSAPDADSQSSDFRPLTSDLISRSSALSEYERFGFNTADIAISGIAAGTPGSWDKVFREGNIDEILRGQNMIETVSGEKQQKQVDKNIVRVIKSATGDHRIEKLDSIADAIKLAAVRGQFDIEKEFGVPQNLVKSLNSTSRLAMAAGILALKDAGIPLVQLYKKTSTGSYLPERWALPESIGEETGVIFASAFPVAESLISEVSRHLVDKYRNKPLKELWEVYDAIIQKLHDARDRQAVSTWFAQNFNKYHQPGGEGAYTFSQNFLLKTIPIGNSQFAQWVRARGPSVHISAACASTTEAVGMAEDWIRLGRAKRVVVIAADDITNDTVQDWFLAGFVASGAATTKAGISEAALPFDKRRHGMITGMGAVSIVVEDEKQIRERGMKPLVRILGSEYANSAFHATRLDTAHVAEIMDRLVTKVEKRYGLDRKQIA